MRRYPALVHFNQDSALGATFPDLPGCYAAADSFGNLPYAASQALNLWFEDMPEVVPSSLDELRLQPEIASELANGAVLLMFSMVSGQSKT